MDELAQQLIITAGPTVGAGTPEPTPIVITGPLQNIDKLSDLINLLLNNLVFPLAGVIVFFILIWGGYDLIMSAGDAEKVSAGQKKITSAIIGLVLLVVSYLVTQLIGFIFGVGGGIF